MNDSAEGRRMTVEIISWSISTKVWDRAGIELATPGSCCDWLRAKPGSLVVKLASWLFDYIGFSYLQYYLSIWYSKIIYYKV